MGSPVRKDKPSYSFKIRRRGINDDTLLGLNVVMVNDGRHNPSNLRCDCLVGVMLILV
jgi:hypothetical protein